VKFAAMAAKLDAGFAEIDQMTALPLDKIRLAGRFPSFQSPWVGATGKSTPRAGKWFWR
jgi:hypothetical protein